MSKLTSITEIQAIKIMEDNLRKINEFSGSNKFFLLHYDLEKSISFSKMWVNKEKGLQIIKNCKTFVLNKDNEEDVVTVLSMYTELQENIYNIYPVGEKYDMIIFKSTNKK